MKTVTLSVLNVTGCQNLCDIVCDPLQFCCAYWHPTRAQKLASVPAIFIQVHKIVKGDYQLSWLSVRPSVCMKRLGTHRTDFHDLIYIYSKKNIRENSSYIKIG